MKLLRPALLIGLLLASSAQAAPISFTNIFNGSLSSWQTVGTVDDSIADAPNGPDTQFTLLNLTGLAATDAQWINVTIQEAHSGLSDVLYNVVFTPNVTSAASPFFATSGYTDGLSSIGYQVTALKNEFLASVRLDVNAAGATATESDVTTLSDVSLANPAFLTLTSLGGQPDPISPPGSHINFSPRKTVFVNNSFDANGGLINSVSNQFDVHTVPEPAIPLSLGLGLIGLGFMKNKSKLSANTQVSLA